MTTFASLPLADPLVIPAELWAEMLTHVRGVHPQEGCGILAGKDGRPVAFLPTANAEQSPVRYAIAAEDLIRITRTLDQHGWDLLAIFHSHPATAAEPSPTDIRLAYYPDSLYLIVSLKDQANPVLRGFWIRDNTVQEHPVAIGGTV